MRPAFSRAHGKLENFRVVETRRDVTTFSLETLRVANQDSFFEWPRQSKLNVNVNEMSDTFRFSFLFSNCSFWSFPLFYR